MDAQKVAILLSREEGPKLDFKVKLSTDTESSKKELAKDICAIANSRGGRGYILFGIEDKTKNVIGICAEEFGEEKIQQVISTRIDPPVPISVDIVKFNGKDIGVITIYSTDQKPHQIRETGTFYIRRGSTTDIMHKEEIASMMQDNGIISFELLPVIKASINDLDEEKVKDFLVKSSLPPEINNEILKSTGIITTERDYGEYHPSCGGLLLFGKTPQNFLPHAVIRVHNNINPSYPAYNVSAGTILDMLDNACSFISKCLNGYSFSMAVVEDLLGKSVIHRDYFEIYSCIEVHLYRNNIEITNPGAAVKGTGNSKDRYIRRNMWLYLKALAIDSNNKYFNKHVDNIKEYKKIKFFNILSKNTFKAILPIEQIKK